MNTLKKSLNVRLIIGLIFIAAIAIGSKTQAQNTLDKVGLTSSSPAAAYSLRLLSSGYSGPLVRITIGINYYDVYPDATTGGFTTNSKVSASISTYNAAVSSAGSNSLSTLITTGVTNASVAVWYDQSGNARNVYQGSTSNQPTIISSGIINSYSGTGVPSLYFNGYNNYFQTTGSATWLSSTAYTIQAVAQTSGASGFNFVVGTQSSGTANNGLSFGWRTTTDFTLDQLFDNADFTTTQMTGMTVMSGVKNLGSGSALWINGTALGTSTAPTANIGTTTGALNIGCGYATNATNWLGYYSESIIFTTAATTANRQTVEANQIAYYMSSPTITVQPSTVPQNLTYGGTTTALSVTATTTYGTITGYQWYSNTANSNIGGTLIVGATNSSYTPSNTTAGTTYYYVVVTNSLTDYISSNVSGGVSVVNALDKVGLTIATPAANAYSLRLLSSGYTGPLVRILIGSNYYDVYPDATTGAFTTNSKVSASISTYNAAIATVGSNALSSLITAKVTNATVAVWYDQSGNARSVYQANTSNQPTIITSGTINSYNGTGIPSLYFNGNNNYLQSTVKATWLNNTAYTIQAVAQTPGASGFNYVVGTLSSGTTDNGEHFGWRTTTDFTIAQLFDDADYTTTKMTGMTVMSGVKNLGSGSALWLNGTAMGTSTSPTGNIGTTTGPLNIGCGYATNATNWLGYYSESIIFTSAATTANRKTVETNQMGYYAAGPTTATINITACGSYIWHGTTYTASINTPTFDTLNKAGFDSLTTLNLTIKSPSTSSLSINICSGNSYIFNGTSYTTSGTYTYHTTNAVGCDSAATLILTVYSPTVLDSIAGISSICVGGTIQLSNSNTGGTWNSSNNYIGPINASGLFTANAPGTATITYTYTNPGGCVSSKTKVITVNNVPYTGPLLGSSTVCTGNNDTLVAAGSGIWTTSNPTIATNVNGIITGITAGVDTVIYTLTNSFGCTTVTTAPITVLSNPIHLDTIVGNSIVCVGSTIQLSNSTPGGLWSSFDHYVATISATGLVTGNAYGTSNITYYVSNSSGCHNSITKVISTVNDPYTGPIVGSNIVCTSNNDTLRAAGSGNWTSSNTSIATINNGIVTGLTAGTDTIIYVLTNSYGCVTTTTAPITVLSNPILLDTIVGPSNVCVGSTIQLTNSIPGGTWSSFSNYAGTITQTGFVTGNNYGNTTITYYVSNSNGCYAKTTKVISTQNLPYAGTITGSGSLCNGNTVTLKPTVSNGVWSSTNNNITTVNGSGVVTGVSGGTDSIVYKITNSYGCVSTLYKSITDASTSSLTTASICNGSSYLFNGTSYNTTGTYTTHLTNAAGCDSAATVKLTVLSKTTSTTTASICYGSSYTFNGNAYTAAGTYTVHLTNSVGCDSAATLVVAVKLLSTSTTTASICNGSSYTFNGNAYTAAGTYAVHLTNSVGCDSAATLVVAVKSLSTSTTTASICSGSSYTFNGTAYTTAGSYTVHLTNSVGCDSSATLVLTVKATSTTSTTITACSNYVWNGTTYTASGTYTYSTVNAVGCDSTATLVLTINEPTTSSTSITACTSYVWNSVTYTTSGTYTYSTVNAVGCDSTATLNLTINQPTADTLNVSTCDSYTWHGATYTTSGTYTFDSLNIAGCDSLTTLNLSICSDTGSVTSGGTGGLESKSLGAAIGERNFNMYKNGKNGAAQYTEAELITAPKRGSFGTFGITTTSSLLATMPDAVRTYIPYDQSASVSDLTGITNAVEVHAIDFTQSNMPKAVAFATKTIGNIYGHTKPICDRLKGAELQDIAKVSIQGMNFIQYKLLQPNGDMEYAISFSAGIKAGRGTYSIQSDWLMPDYTSEDTMYNYQLWAASPVDVATMVTEVLGKLQVTMPVAQLFNANDLPSTYVSSISRQGTNINLVVNNNTPNTTGYFQLTIRETENSTTSSNQVVPFTVGANGKTTIAVPIGDTYDANISMVFNNTTTDMLYMADGIWGTNGDNQTTVSQFNVSNNDNRTYPENEYPLLRNVQVQVTTPTYLSIYKYLKGGAIAVDLNEYKSLHFTANTNIEGMNLQVTIVKQGITNWNSQYTYTISNYQDGQTYKLALSDFKSTDNTLPAVMDASDVTTVIYNVINPTGQSTSITTGISNAAFSTEDIAYEKSLEVKTLGVSPNPNNGNFKVTFASPATAQLTLKVIDITGRIINSTAVNAITGTNEVSVSLNQGGTTGIYFVALEGQGVKYESKEMILKK